MSTFRHLTLSIVGVLTMLTQLVQLVGTTQPSPLAVLFTNADGTPCERPCLLGVQPGKTPADEAIRLLQAHPFARGFEPGIAGNVLLGEHMSLVVYSLGPGDPVWRIGLWKRPGPPYMTGWGTLGQVIALLGAPDRVEVSGTATLSYYHVQRLQFVHRHRIEGRLSPDDPVEDVAVYAELPVMQQSAGLWNGFISTRRYPAVRRTH